MLQSTVTHMHPTRKQVAAQQCKFVQQALPTHCSRKEYFIVEMKVESCKVLITFDNHSLLIRLEVSRTQN